MNELAMKIGDTLNVINSEKAVCKECLEDEFWKCYRVAKREQNLSSIY